MKKYTIKDIAEMAGVSKGTVDRVIHNRGNVAKSVESKVKQLLKDIDYTPNLIAQNLKNNKVHKIAVLMPDPKKDAYWEPCLSSLDEITSEFSAFDMDISVFHFDPFDKNSFLSASKTMLHSEPDAVLMAPLFSKEGIAVLAEIELHNIKVCTFNNQTGSTQSTAFIGQDLIQSGRVAAKLFHVLDETGDKAVIHIDEKYKNAIFMQKKETGFRNYFNELSNFDAKILKCSLKQSNLDSKLADFLNKNPNINGLFVTTSKTYQVAKVLDSLNLNHIRLVGYDLLSENVDYLLNGSIDFLIHQNPRQQVYLGLKLLTESLLYGKPLPKQFLLPIDIINSENVRPFMRS